MKNITQGLELPVKPAREWMQILARYREPKLSRSVVELLVTAIPFVLLWAAAWWALQVHYLLTLLIAIPAAGFLVRLFTIQHDCGHGSFFKSRQANDWVGRCIGVLTMTPYYVWKKAHAIHHASSGNLDKRGIGAIHTLTVREYQALPLLGRIGYRLFRNPITLFVIGPAYVFVIQNRLPVEFMTGGWRYWASAMGTNLSIALLFGGMIWLVGWQAFLLVHVPILLMAATAGVWLFYVQHQFEETSWDETDHWDLQEAALYGSSHYDLPFPLRWITGNIGIHHVHHLNSRIPFYRLGKVLRDHPALKHIKRLTLWQSLGCIRLHLWCETRRRLITFAEAKRVPVPA